MKAHCLFEQSGTFKNEFRKLGIEAYDYDILNDFGETDHQLDLFQEIERGGNGEPSIFDTFTPDDLIMAFFPCTRFETMDMLNSRCESMLMNRKSDVWKLRYSMAHDEERHRNYRLVSTLAIIAFERHLKMVIENPYHPSQHYLALYWPLKPAVIDRDRTINGDYYHKPTQFWFIGLEPKQNMYFEPIEHVETKTISSRKAWREKEISHEKQVEASMIHPQYARRFIKSYLL